ncbi:MAG: hypothetical protein M3Y87_12365 [Myxococcota bacterium]|nr:hypothetical protein [Myxococcota bacterium]
MRPLVFVSLSLLSIVCSLVRPSGASAQAAHPRAARALLLMESAPVVLVAPDRAWLSAAVTGEPLSICGGDRCRPVRAIEACEPPRCPGHGRVAITEGQVADVPDFPTGYDDYERERAALSAEPTLAALAPYLAPHPRPPSYSRVAWSTNGREELRWELDTSLGAAYWTHSDLGAIDWRISGGFRFVTGEDDEGALGFFIPASLGFDVRVMLLGSGLDQPGWDTTFAIGAAPSISFVLEDTVRLPGFLALIVPEVGVIVSAERPAALYLGWQVPVDVLVDEHLALSARASLMMIDDWVEGDGVEAIVSLRLGFVVR